MTLNLTIYLVEAEIVFPARAEVDLELSTVPYDNTLGTTYFYLVPTKLDQGRRD